MHLRVHIVSDFIFDRCSPMYRKLWGPSIDDVTVDDLEIQILNGKYLWVSKKPSSLGCALLCAGFTNKFEKNAHRP